MSDFSDADTVVDHVRFGRFRIEQLLGRELALSDPAEFAELRERFRREAIAGAQLRGSPYLVTVYELSIAEDTPYLVQEYVPGGDLRNLLKQRGVLPVGRALEILADAARGLAVMHDHNFVHRDVKPGNIFLTLDGRAKIGDFGIVQDGMTLRSPTSAKSHPYTAAYASPEQMTSTGYLRPQSDQYSLGVVLFEMLTGKRYRNLEADGVRRALAVLPTNVVAIFSRMTAEDPDDRYPDMEAVVNALTTVDYGPSPIQATDPFPRQEGAASRHSAIPRVATSRTGAMGSSSGNRIGRNPTSPCIPRGSGGRGSAPVT